MMRKKIRSKEKDCGQVTQKCNVGKTEIERQRGQIKYSSGGKDKI